MATTLPKSSILEIKKFGFFGHKNVNFGANEKPFVHERAIVIRNKHDKDSNQSVKWFSTNHAHRNGTFQKTKF